MRVTLGSARPGDLVELAAALGDGHPHLHSERGHSGSLLLLPIEALRQAFESYPPLRMRLLEELAREVSRAYITCCLTPGDACTAAQQRCASRYRSQSAP